MDVFTVVLRTTDRISVSYWDNDLGSINNYNYTRYTDGQFSSESPEIVIFIGLLANLMPGLLYLTGIPIVLVLGKAFEGVVKSMIWNGGWSLSLQSADPEIESETSSIFLLGVNLAAIIGPVIGGLLIASKGFDITFALWVFSAWLGALTFYLYVGLEGKNGFIESLEELFHRKTYSDEYTDLKQNWSNLKLPLSLIFLYSILFSFFWLAVPFYLIRWEQAT